MKKIYCFFLIIFIFSAKAQDKLSKLNTSKLNTFIVIGAEPLQPIHNFQDKTINAYSFLQVYSKLKSNDKNSTLKTSLTPRVTNLVFDGSPIDLAIITSSYATINPEAFTDGRLSVNSNQEFIQNSTNSVFEEFNIGLASPLTTTHKGLKASFNLRPNQIINTLDQSISKIEMDFNDGNGFKIIQPNQPFIVNYASDGQKEILTKITLDNGNVFKSTSEITIQYSAENLNSLFNAAVTTFQSTTMAPPNLTPYGEVSHRGTGEYDIYLSSDNILDKPIFLIDGFDPGDTRNTLAIYDLLNFDDNGTTSNLGDLVRAEGFDIVILNFPTYLRAADNVLVDGGADYIERNAMLLAELITLINGQKVGTEPNVVIGPSMGGLISRYALNFMEQQNLNHDTRLWISFDSPQLGANVPIGFQYLFNRMAYGLDLGSIAGDQSVVALRPIIDGMLKSPAARQMLTDQFESHLANGSTVDFNPTLTLPAPHPFHTLFFNGLNALTPSGYPENLRKVSMINGSGINARYKDKTNNDILPNREVLNTIIEDVGFQTDATFKTRFTPSTSATNQAAFVYIDAIWFCFCDLTVSANSQAFSFTNGIDAASGGLFDLGALSGSLGTDPLINAFFTALQTDYFNFIPTISSLALEVTNNEINWFHTPNNLTTASVQGVNNITPFDNWYMPDDNEPHITLTRPNVDFALSEILPSTLGTTKVNYNKDIVLLENPVGNSIKLKTSKLFESKITLIDMTGKLVYNNTQKLNGLVTLPVAVNAGLYILNIETPEHNFQFKILKD